MTRVIAATVILSESDMPRIKDSRNPWIKPPGITLEMELLAKEILVNNSETLKFIREIEGPTKTGWINKVLISLEKQGF